MNEFEYRVSVIVPVYNVGRLLRNCLDSLVNQTMEEEQMEVLLINDGSTDDSLEICREYARVFDNFKVFSQENSGVSSARNLGIKAAKGKYIMYLDADDMLSEETLESVAGFFDSVYDEVDLVTYKRMLYQKGKAPVLISRYQYLNKTGVYDLNEIPYCAQMTLNIAVKNRKDVLFDTSLFQGEDQKYVMESLIPKMRLGYCERGEYKYIRHGESAVATQAYSYYLFEQRMKLWHDILGKYQEAPPYIQAVILDNWVWELSGDCIFPYHYKGEKYTEAIQRLKWVLSYIDVDMILNHSKMDLFHKHFWIAFKDNIKPVVICEKDNISVIVKEKRIYKRDNIEIVLNQVDVRKEELHILGFVKSPAFNYINTRPKVYAFADGREILIPVFESIHGCYKSRAHTNCFWAFRFRCDVRGIKELHFKVGVDGILYDTQYYCMPSSVFNKKLGVTSFIRNGFEIAFDGHTFLIKPVSFDQQRELELSRKFLGKVSDKVYKLRKNAIRNHGTKQIWLYSDQGSAGEDNAYYQFQHDWNKQDDIERWYVYDGHLQKTLPLFNQQQRKNLVAYGSDLHKMLYLCASYILCSFSDKRPRIPFATDAEFAYYRDLRQPLTIYLQHGVCHADLRYLQSAERCKADKIVVSSDFEKINFIRNYHYEPEDIITTGMARYDHIDKNGRPQNRILFAPSWRSYLMEKNEESEWEKKPEKLLKSDYFIKFTEFLNSRRLTEILEKNDLYLDAKMHPHMKSALELFQTNSKRMRLVSDGIKVEHYKIFITDFSSFVFDYAYLNRPILYFVPDMEQFESGMNHYRKLDLPFEEAFGKLTLSADGACDLLEEIIGNNYKVENVYQERMENFYLPLHDCCEGLYEYLTDRE